MTHSTVVLRRVTVPSRRRLYQALAREESRTQLADEKSVALARKQSHTQLSKESDSTEQLFSKLLAESALQNEKIVVFLDGQKLVVPRSKLLEWDFI